MTRTRWFLYLTVTLTFAFLAAGHFCPLEYPFAYDEGKYCCAHDEEKMCKNGPGCNGSKIGNSSVCCKNDEFIPCVNKPCQNYVCYCDPNGEINGKDTCDLLGNCKCNEAQGFTGKDCSVCKPGYYKKGNNCTQCGCDPKGMENGTCDGEGKCKCKHGYGGTKCGTKEKGKTIGNMSPGQSIKYLMYCYDVSADTSLCSFNYLRVESDDGIVDVTGYALGGPKFCEGIGQYMPKDCVLFSQPKRTNTLNFYLTTEPGSDPAKNVRVYINSDVFAGDDVEY